MAEYIERDMFLKIISHKPSSPTTGREDRLINGFISAVKNCPAADVRPVVKARWEKVMEQPYFRKHYHVVACSACHKRGNQGWNFCPNCGADMREAEEGE